jgi:hypothetical protein
MSLVRLAETVQRMREDDGVRDAVAEGEVKLLSSFSEEEREAIQALARRLQRGQGLPKHLKRSKSVLQWLET